MGKKIDIAPCESEESVDVTKSCVSKPTGYGSISRDEVMPLREAARRLGWGVKTVARAQREGLQTTLFGKLKYVQGADVIEFFQRLANRQAASHARETV